MLVKFNGISTFQSFQLSGFQIMSVICVQCWVVTRYKSNALLFGVTSQVTRYYLPKVTLQVTSYFLQ